MIIPFDHDSKRLMQIIWLLLIKLGGEVNLSHEDIFEMENPDNRIIESDRPEENVINLLAIRNEH